MNKQQVGLYIVITVTGIVALLNAIAPFFSPQVAGILTVIASIAAGFLHQGAVNTAVAGAKQG